MVRTIIIGDVHGCRTELEALLDRVAFASGDRLVFVGDLVARGPDSLGVLDVARRTGAIVVRGNHEQKLLDIRAGQADDGKYPLHRELARELRPVDWTLLETSPVYLDLPEHGASVVHAGVQPGLPLAEQAKLSPNTLMRIRTVRVRQGEGNEKHRTDRLWGETYVGPPQIVFGHNAAPGLQLHPWATGLDTGCVYGGRLTAMVLNEGQRIPRSIASREELLRYEPAQRVWFSPQKTVAVARTGSDAA